MDDLNPAVERALAAAGNAPTGADWLRVLLADDEGRPAMLLSGLGLSVAGFLEQIAKSNTDSLNSFDLLRKAREQSIRLRGDPAITTDLMLAAVLFNDPMLAAALGARLDLIESALRSPMIETPEIVDEMREAPFSIPDVTDRGDAARIVDANLNRARESLRVLDDYARFVRNDAILTEALKSLRHRLADIAAHLPLPSLLAARDTQRDVGTSISIGSELSRDTPSHVAAVNCKRLQESLRSVEEFGKLLGPHVAREVEAIRYESYTLERALFGGSPLRERIAAAKLYALLSGEGCTASLDWTVAEAAAGGVEVFQLREKKLNDRELLARAIEMRRWTRENRTLFIVNDRVDIARFSDADGVHLGQDDLSVADARRILGPQPLIGVSTHNLDQVRRAVHDGADYLGIGPCFASSTKSFEALAGMEFIAAAVKATSLPAFALGGINAKTIGTAMAAGATRVAVSAAIAEAEEPRLAAQILVAALAK